ncbi:MAG: D-Ala-D-Ala carboxypeptidase family metallohydrolase [Allosphingosinicella sp.]
MASLFVVPGAVLSQNQSGAGTVSAKSATAAADRAQTPRPPASPAQDPILDHEAEHHHDSGLAPGQTYADYETWLARSPRHRAEVTAFRTRLAAEGVADIVPVWQLVRTSSSWRQCAAQPFEVAPADKWDHIVATLKFVRDQVVPSVGRVEALSAYRNERLNDCSDGAPASAHRMFFALDLTPVAADVSRDEMVRDVCRAHARVGRTYEAGLGFYSGRRFHVDSNGYRKWGPDGRGASSPCVRYS